MTTNATKGKASGRVSLQKRDLDVLEALVQMRAETLDELHVQFFAGLSRKRAVNRLAQLARAGFLSRADVILVGDAKPTQTYTLGPKARPALERRSLSSEHFRFRRWNPTLRDASIPHQVAVNRLGRMTGTPILPEHLLPVAEKGGAKHRPDAVIEGVDVEGRTRLLGIEVDLGHYSRERIIGKKETWSSYPDHGALVFVVPDAARANRVRSWIGQNAYHVHVHTFEEWREVVERARADDGLILDLDIWTGGDAWAAERARIDELNRQWAEEDRLAEERRANERRLKEQRWEAEEAQRRLAATRKPRRRFGV